MFLIAHRPIIAAALVSILALLLAACGGGGSGESSGSTAQPNQPTTPSAKPLGSHSLELLGSAPEEHAEISLKVSGSGDVLRYEWDFGDGKTETGTTPFVQHTFVEGEYTIGVTAIGAVGDTSKASLQLKVRHKQPELSIGLKDDSETPWMTAGVLYFTSRLNYDSRRRLQIPNGNSYLWDFGDGSTDNSPAPSHAYAKAGDYTVTLTLTDAHRRTSSATRKVKVAGINARPLRTPLGGPGYQDMGALSLFNRPRALVRATNGTLFVYDSGNRAVRSIQPNGLVSTLAGARTQYAELRDGRGQEARFADIQAMALDSDGSLYLAGEFDGLRHMAPDGTVRTLVAAAGNTAGDESKPVSLVSPRALALRSDGSLYVSHGNGIALYKKGEISLIAGQVRTKGYLDGPASEARFGAITALAMDKQDRLLVLDACGGLRRLDQDGRVRTVVPLETPSINPENCYPRLGGMAVAADGSVYLNAGAIARAGSPTLMRIGPDGNQQVTFAGSEAMDWIVIDGSDLLFTSISGHSNTISGHTIKRRRSNGAIVVEAGRDGDDSTVQFPEPAASDLRDVAESMAITSDGNVYLSSGGKLLRFDPRSQQASMFYDNWVGDRYTLIADGPRGQAGISYVRNLTADGSGRLYFDDGSTIRCSTADGWLRTIAGSAAQYGDEDGPGHLARFGPISRIAADKSGNIYVLTRHSDVSRVALIDSNGTVRTLLRTKSNIYDLALAATGQLVLKMGVGMQLLDKDGTLKTLNSYADGLIKGWATHPDGSIWMLSQRQDDISGMGAPPPELVRIHLDGRVEKVVKLSTVKAALFFGRAPVELSIGASVMAFRADGSLLISGDSRRGSYWLLENLP